MNIFQYLLFLLLNANIEGIFTTYIAFINYIIILKIYTFSKLYQF